MIVPPPEIKTLIDKLAKKVATQPADKQDQFVELVVQQDAKKFSFLKNDQDPYRPYFDQKLSEERALLFDQP